MLDLFCDVNYSAWYASNKVGVYYVSTPSSIRLR